MLGGFRDSWAGQTVLAPFDVFSWTIAAQTIPELLGWGLLALGIDLLLVAAVVRLDANFLEAAVVASQKRYEAIQRMKSGGTMTVGRRFTLRWRVPFFPWLGGAGPIARRQTIHLLRGSLRFLMFMGLVVLGVSIGLLAVGGAVRKAVRGNACGGRAMGGVVRDRRRRSTVRRPRGHAVVGWRLG